MTIRLRIRLQGFTLVELLTVIAIVAVLLALLLPAVQGAREAARAARCTARLHNLGAAFIQYADAHGYLPPDNMQWQPLEAGATFSPFARILPYLEQSGVAELCNFSLRPTIDRGLAANQTAMRFSIEDFLCPSDPPEVEGFGRAGYRVNVGLLYFGIWPPNQTLFYHGGPFRSHFPAKLRDVTDGLSKTAAASERLQGDWLSDVFSPGDYKMALPNERPFLSDYEYAVPFCEALPADRPVNSRGGESWFVTGRHFTAYDHTAPPNSSTTDCCYIGCQYTPGILGGTDWEGGVTGARSAHPGGVNMALLDGSCRFVGDHVSLDTWHALGTMASKDIVGDY